MKMCCPTTRCKKCEEELGIVTLNDKAIFATPRRWSKCKGYKPPSSNRKARICKFKIDHEKQ